MPPHKPGEEEEKKLKTITVCSKVSAQSRGRIPIEAHLKTAADALIEPRSLELETLINFNVDFMNEGTFVKPIPI